MFSKKLEKEFEKLGFEELDVVEESSGDFYVTYSIEGIQHENDIPDELARFTIDEFGGCCGIGILHSFGLFTYDKTRILCMQAMIEFAKHQAIEDKVTTILYSTIDEQKELSKQLVLAGFKKIHRFRNKSTGNFVNLYQFTSHR